MLKYRYNEKVDVYSFALVLLEIALSHSRHVRMYFKSQYCAATKAQGGLAWRPPIPLGLYQDHLDLVKLIEACWPETFPAHPPLSLV